MKRNFFPTIIFFIFFVGILKAQTPVSISDLKKHVYVLASDSLEGRRAGSRGGEKATNYILSEFEGMKLQLKGENGLDCFSIESKKKPSQSSFFVSGNYHARLGNDYMPFLNSYCGSLSSGVVFVGYGIQEEFYNDYEKVDVNGKWVMIFRGKPKSDKFPLETSKYDYKIRKALENGAFGILFVAPDYSDQQEDIDNSWADARLHYSQKEVLLLKIKRAVADSLLSGQAFLNVEKLTAICEKGETPCSFDLEINLDATVSFDDNDLQACNIIGFLEGSDSRFKNEIIVLGAHRDHLGIAKKGVDKQADIFHGADDNASGTAGLIELAKVFSNLPERPKRSILFISFDAEEMGLIGSMEFLKNLPDGLQSSQIKAMINLDMIGRYQTGGLEIIGSNSSKEGTELVKKYAKKTSMNAKIISHSDFFYASDHANFYLKEIPVFFFFTGIHDDYHQITDTAEKIDYDDMKKILDVVYLLTDDLANRKKNLQFKRIN